MDEVRSEPITSRVTPTERALLVAAARQEEGTVSAIVRASVRRRLVETFGREALERPTRSVERDA